MSETSPRTSPAPLETPAPELLRRLLDLEPRAPLRAVADRVTFSWPEDDPRWIVKRTTGDHPREAWYDRLHGAGGRSPGRREYENLAALSAGGFPVPRPVGWTETGRGAPGPRRSLVVMERVPHEETLRDRLRAGGDPEARRWLGPVADLVAGLHGAGWYHRDLYLQHLVPTPDGALVLLDVGRARRQGGVRRRWFVKDLAALLHSAPGTLARSWRVRFLAAYLARRGIAGRAETRRWAHRVERKRRRLAAHVPRE